MIPLHKWTEQLDEEPPDNIFEIAKAKGMIRSRVERMTELTEKEHRNYQILEIESKRKYRLKWVRYLERYLKYKKPFFINGAHFTNLERDDDLEDFQNPSLYEDDVERIPFGDTDTWSRSDHTPAAEEVHPVEVKHTSKVPTTNQQTEADMK